MNSLCAIVSLLLFIAPCSVLGIDTVHPNAFRQITNNDNNDVAEETLEKPSPSSSDRNPLIEWLQNIFNRPTTTERPLVLEPPDHCDECNCGIANKQKRIVGGHETEVNEYPWMGLLRYGGRFYCGCSLINDRYVLTAAHCVQGFNAKRISVLLLEHDRSKENETTTISRNVMWALPHPGYSSRNFNNDIALLRLDKSVNFTNNFRPVCLPTPRKSWTGYDGIITGWGAIKEGGSISDTLQEVTVPIISNAACKKSGYGSSRITDNMLCAGIAEGGKDSCQGDSGGPLHIKNETIYEVVGVVSWGEGCAQKNYPGVYSRVNRYGTWIRSNTRDSCYCTGEKAEDNDVDADISAGSETISTADIDQQKRHQLKY